MKIKLTNDYISSNYFDLISNNSVIQGDKIVLLKPQNVRLLGLKEEELYNFIIKIENEICDLEYVNLYILNDYLIKNRIKNFYSYEENAQINIIENREKIKQIDIEYDDYKLILNSIARLNACNTVKNIIISEKDDFDYLKKIMIKAVTKNLLISRINYSSVKKYIKEKYNLSVLNDLEIIYGEQAIRG